LGGYATHCIEQYDMASLKRVIDNAKIYFKNRQQMSQKEIPNNETIAAMEDAIVNRDLKPNSYSP